MLFVPSPLEDESLSQGVTIPTCASGILSPGNASGSLPATLRKVCPFLHHRPPSLSLHRGRAKFTVWSSTPQGISLVLVQWTGPSASGLAGSSPLMSNGRRYHHCTTFPDVPLAILIPSWRTTGTIPTTTSTVFPHQPLRAPTHLSSRARAEEAPPPGTPPLISTESLTTAFPRNTQPPNPSSLMTMSSASPSNSDRRALLTTKFRESPYPEVRAAVSNIDDPTMPVNIIRM